MKYLMYLITVLITIFCWSGCSIHTALQQLLQSPTNLKNYALQSNGAQIIVGGEIREGYYSYYNEPILRGNPQHPKETLINGNYSSRDWIQGEGWECIYECFQGQENDNYTNMGDNYIHGSEGFNIVTVAVEFPKEVQLNRVVVYTIDSPEYPASQYGVKDVGLRYLTQNNIWPFVALERKTKYPGRIDNNHEGIIDFRFKPVKTQAIKICIYDTNDSRKITANRWEAHKVGVVRLIEIEAYGTEKKDGVVSSSSDDLTRLFK